MKKLLIISGPTATGKTALAAKLAKKYHGELISADSRQIYKGMDIGTGKDQPKDIPIHLIDLITPDQAFSVAQYQKIALAKIQEIQSRHFLPIVVGGTGLYINSLLNYPTNTYSVKPNKFLRFFLNKLSVIHLQKLYTYFDKKSFLTLNNSEVHNPHRLIRKIEIKLSHILKPSLSREGEPEGWVGFDPLHLSLTAPSAYLYKKIDQRVESRLQAGLLEEITNLLKKYNWSSPGLNCLAYKEFRSYFLETHDRASLLNTSISRWRFHEHAYARRQKTWFKKDISSTKFDISKAGYQPKLLKLVDLWYNKP